MAALSNKFKQQWKVFQFDGANHGSVGRPVLHVNSGAVFDRLLSKAELTSEDLFTHLRVNVDLIAEL